MEAFLPTSWLLFLSASLVLAGIVTIGFTIQRALILAGRLSSWCPTTGGIVSMERLTAGEPPGFRMLGLIGAALYGMKCVAAVESRAAFGTRLTLRRWLAFTLGWFGMDARIFAAPRSPLDRREARALIRRGFARLVAGALLVGVARAAAFAEELGALATALALVGSSLVLHFGVFNVVAGAWRRLGFRCDPLFRAPLLATSLREFWGRRWNLGFFEMTVLVVYRPARRRIGPSAAVVVAFLFSGLLHEMALSLPVGAGFGLPTFYFLLHGLALCMERRGALSLSGLGAPLWTALWLVLPLPLLFHAPFLRGVIWPLVGID